MNRERIAFYVEYLSDLALSIFLAIVGLTVMTKDGLGWFIVGLFVFLFFGVMYFQQSVTALITGKKPNRELP